MPDGLRGKRIGILRTLQRQGSVVGRRCGDARQACTGDRTDAGAGRADRRSRRHRQFRYIGWAPNFVKALRDKVDRDFAALFNRAQNWAHKTWADVCNSGLIRPEWTARQCRDAGASSAVAGTGCRARIGNNRSRLMALMDRSKLDAIVYPTDGRGGARDDCVRSHHLLHRRQLGPCRPRRAPMALDRRGMPIGIEWLGRLGSDEDPGCDDGGLRESARGRCRHRNDPMATRIC